MFPTDLIRRVPVSKPFTESCFRPVPGPLSGRCYYFRGAISFAATSLLALLECRQNEVLEKHGSSCQEVRMKELSLFYSYQSDRPRDLCRDFIEKALRAAILSVPKELDSWIQ